MEIDPDDAGWGVRIVTGIRGVQIAGFQKTGHFQASTQHKSTTFPFQYSGNPPVALNATADYGIRVSNYRVVYGYGSTIYTQPLFDPTAVSEPISGGLPIDGYAADFKIADDDQWILFRSQVDSNRYELYASNVGAPPMLGLRIFLPALSRSR